MQTTHPFSTQSKIPFAAALLAAFCLLFLPGYGKTPEDHARIASDSSVRPEKRLASVEALAAANEQLLLADIAKNDSDGNVRMAALEKLHGTGPTAPAQ